MSFTARSHPDAYRPGAYVANRRRLFLIVDWDGELLVLENAVTSFRHRMLLATLMRETRVVRETPRVPDAPPDWLKRPAS